jgi:OmpA-OmpF porin, OOP family
MKKHYLKTTAVTLLGCAISSAVHAQSSASDYNSSWYILPSLNAIDPDTSFGINKRGAGAGLRVGKAISPSWDIQFGPSYSRVKSGADRYEQGTLGVDALYMFSRGNFRPFLLLGAGAEYDKTDMLGTNTSRVSPYVNAGLGLQVSFNDRWGMQADLRRAASYVNNKAFPIDRANTSIFTLALTYSFDGPKAPMQVAQREATPAYTPPPAVAEPAPIAQAPAPTPPPPPPPPAPPPAPAPRFEKITLSSTDLFSFDSSELPAQHAKLDAIANALNKDTGVNNVSITGYTDRLGSSVYNIRLSQRRADAVKAYLTQKGIAGTRMVALGKGEANPVVQCNERKMSVLIECLQPNRRVEVDNITIEQRVQ